MKPFFLKIILWNFLWRKAVKGINSISGVCLSRKGLNEMELSTKSAEQSYHTQQKVLSYESRLHNSNQTQAGKMSSSFTLPFLKIHENSNNPKFRTKPFFMLNHERTYNKSKVLTRVEDILHVLWRKQQMTKWSASTFWTAVKPKHLGLMTRKVKANCGRQSKNHTTWPIATP